MTIVDPRLAPLAAIFDLNTDLLLNCLDGLSDAEGRERLAGGGNSITFLAARVGHPLDNPMAPYLEGARGFEEVRAWPALEQVRSAWRSVSTHLQRTLASLAPEQLSRRHAHRFPLGDSTQLGLIAFLAQHDAYHLGQVAFLRRQLGRPAMSYARPANA
jgi:hypothetical protein